MYLTYFSSNKIRTKSFWIEGGCCPGLGDTLWVQRKSSLGSHRIYYGMFREEPKVRKAGYGDLGMSTNGKMRGKGAKRAGSSWLASMLLSYALHPASTACPQPVQQHP